MTLPTVLTLRNYVVSALPELADQVDRLISESFALGLKVGTKPRPRKTYRTVENRREAFEAAYASAVAVGLKVSITKLARAHDVASSSAYRWAALIDGEQSREAA